MTTDERREMREMLHEILSGYQALNESQYTVMDVKLDGINKRLDTLNGKTQKTVERVEVLEKAEALHTVTCPNLTRIRTIEDNQLSVKSVKTWVISSVGIASLVVGIIFVIFKMVTGL